jgi:hypothetical protein
VLVDNNPTNIAMLLFAPAVRRIAQRTYLWVEHIPDPSKGRGKLSNAHFARLAAPGRGGGKLVGHV